MEKSNVTTLPNAKVKKEKNNIQNSLSPREIVSELDRFVVGQNNAKRAVAIALRNRWRRQALEGDMKDEVLPKNILMMGPTGVGKTEISRRLSKLEKHAGNLSRSAVELAKDWRTDKYLRRLEALMAVADKEKSFIISGTGDVLEPEGDVIGIGSGGNYALAAAKVLMDTDMSAEEVAKKAIKVASDICVFTNNNLNIEKV